MKLIDQINFVKHQPNHCTQTSICHCTVSQHIIGGYVAGSRGGSPTGLGRGPARLIASIHKLSPRNQKKLGQPSTRVQPAPAAPHPSAPLRSPHACCPHELCACRLRAPLGSATTRRPHELLGVDLKTKNLVITCVSALCWAIWISRNNLVFDKAQMMTYLQVLFRSTHWLRLWMQLQRSEDTADLIRNACRRLEMVAMQFFAFHG